MQVLLIVYVLCSLIFFIIMRMFNSSAFSASLNRCFDPVLTICSLLTVENEPFANTLDDKLQIKNVRLFFQLFLCLNCS